MHTQQPSSVKSGPSLIRILRARSFVVHFQLQKMSKRKRNVVTLEEVRNHRRTEER